MERDSIITAWESMTGKEQHDMIAACVYQVAQREHGVQALYQHGHSIDEYISEAWLKLAETMTAGEVEQINAQRQQDGKKPITLISMVYRAVRASMSAVVRADRIQDSRDGVELAPEREARKDSTEAVIIAVDLQRFMEQRDSRDKSIAALIGKGLTERQIGEAIGISGPAVHKRIARMRKELIKATA